MSGDGSTGAPAELPAECEPCEASRHTRHTAVGDDGELDIDPMVDQQGCGRMYAALEECLGENDRDWRKCQREMNAFRSCYDSSKQRGAGAPAR